MRAFCIGTSEFNGTRAQAFAGIGGLAGLGRWHEKGHRIVYAASTQALAMLEILVHLKRNRSIRPHVVCTLDTPDDEIAPMPVLSADWTQDILTTRRIGTKWLESMETVAMLVPSAIVPAEPNLLINPIHPSFNLDWVVDRPVPVVFDPRLL